MSNSRASAMVWCCCWLLEWNWKERKEKVNSCIVIDSNGNDIDSDIREIVNISFRNGTSFHMLCCGLIESNALLLTCFILLREI